jgi:hypothetical protein
VNVPGALPGAAELSHGLTSFDLATAHVVARPHAVEVGVPPCLLGLRHYLQRQHNEPRRNHDGRPKP